MRVREATRSPPVCRASIGRSMIFYDILAVETAAVSGSPPLITVGGLSRITVTSKFELWISSRGMTRIRECILGSIWNSDTDPAAKTPLIV